MTTNRNVLLCSCVGLVLSLGAIGCASQRTTATGGTAPAPRTDTADVAAASPAEAQEMKQEQVDRLTDAVTAFQAMMGTPDDGIPEELMQRANCVVVVPGMKKGALIVGAQYGKGYMSCKDAQGWSAPATVRIEGGSLGFQIGGEETDVVMMVMNEQGKSRLLSSQFELGADASVAAGPVGRTATAGTDAYMTAQILGWSRSRGAFAGVSLKGATVREDLDENRALYGRALTNRDIIEGNVQPPGPAAQQFVAMLSKYSTGAAAGANQ